MSAPLRTPANDESGKEKNSPQSPEGLLISALIEEGNFDPHAYHVTDEDLSCYGALWKFCCDHQSRAGRAPSPSLVKTKFPYFEITPDVDVRWAATKLREHSQLNRLRIQMNEAIGKIREEDLQGAYDALDGFMVPVSTRRSPFEGFEHTVEEDELDITRIPVPWEPLGRASGGIGPGEVWAIGARLGQGKTHIVGGCYVARALTEGFSVGYFSLEMPARAIKRRINRALAAKFGKALLTQFDSFELSEHNKALDVLAEQVPGRFGVYDPTHGPCDVHAVRDVLPEYDLVVIDHVGLMRLGNKLAVSDWRIAAEISNRCNEETLRSNGRLIEVVQVNRMGESASPLHTPGMANIGGSDQIGQDASVGITMSRFSTSVMLHSAEKVRDGAGVRWFSRFDPANARFELLTRDQATALAVKDEDTRERHLN